MNTDSPESFWARCRDTTQRDLRNSLRILAALLAWAVCFVGGSQLIKRGLLPAGVVSWAVAALATVAGIVVLVAYARYLREADELHRMIQLQALALGFGGTFVAIAGYRVFERAGAPAIDVADYTLVMVILYSIGLVVGWWRYR